MLALKVISVLFIVQLVSAVPLKEEVRLHPDAGLDIYELIDKYGFESELHHVTTSDGYILGVQRIPGRKGESQTTGKPVVFLMHGLASSATDWCNNRESSLAYILVDLGYDVWLGNARGTTHSRAHVVLDPDVDKAEFWTYSWNEIGSYDLPAMIDHVLTVTGQEQLIYVGHSQGTTSFFVMGSERPEYNAKIKLMLALGPVAFMSNVYSPILKLLAQYEQELKNLTELIGVHEFLPHHDLIADLGVALCEENAPLHEMCSLVIFLICGFDEEQMDPTMLSVIVTNAPAGTAVNQWAHFAQEINSGFFRKFDYGPYKNLELYGQEKPPNYNVENISAPVALFYGINDWLAAEVDIEQLRGLLPNVVKFHKVAFDKFNHLDYIWAKDVSTLLYNDVVDIIQQYS